MQLLPCYSLPLHTNPAAKKHRRIYTNPPVFASHYRDNLYTYTRALVRELAEIAVDDPISTPNCTLEHAHGKSWIRSHHYQKAALPSAV